MAGDEQFDIREEGESEPVAASRLSGLQWERLRGVAVPTPPHPVFDHFLCWQGLVEPGWALNFLGVRTRVEFFSMYEELADFSQERYETTTAPVQNEDYFEWIDLLDGVVNAKGCFRMIELGAGWGRWLASGALAARHLGLDARLIGVEADPDHFRWMRLHFEDNGVDPGSTRLVEAAIAAENGTLWFHTGDSANWYGQSIADGPPANSPRSIASRLRRKNHNRQISAVPAVSLNTLLLGEGVIDLIDADIQGAEADVFEAASDQLTPFVRKVHIGTHSLDNEQRLRVLFGELGWTKVYDFPSNQHSDTPYGRMLFQDGVQSWLNPEL